jgi:hypothetical protein
MIVVMIVTVAVLCRCLAPQMSPSGGTHAELDIDRRLGTPMRVRNTPGVETPHADRVAGKPDVTGSKVIIPVANPPHVFVTVPAVISWNDGLNRHRSIRRSDHTAGHQDGGCDAGNAQYQG